MNSEILIENVGVVQSITIPVVPGITVLRGRNAAGKTTCLKAIQALATGEQPDLEVRDGAGEEERGLVEGLGARFTVARRRSEATAKPDGRNKGTGELEFARLEGLDPMALIEPGIVDPVRADAARIALVCKLARIPTGISVFSDALGADVKVYATTATLKAESLTDMARGLKRDIQGAAREVEERVARLDGEVAANLKASEGVAADALDGDRPNLDAQLEHALQDRSALVTRQAEINSRLAAASRAREQLEAAQAQYDGPTVEAAQESRDLQAKCVDELTRALADAKSDLQAADATLRRAQDHERTIAAWSQSLAAAEGLEPISVEAISDAERRVLEARAAKDAEASLRHKVAARRAADALLSKLDAARKNAETLRFLASRCESVVSDAISKLAPNGLRVKAERLVLDTDRGETCFADLSFGERTRIVAGMIAKSFGGERALVVLPQEVYEGLDPHNREVLDAEFSAASVACVTAEATDGELRVETNGVEVSAN